MSTISTWLSKIFSFLTANILPAVILLAVGILVIQVLTKLISSALNKSKMDKGLTKLALAVIKPVLYLLLGLMTADKLGIDVTGIVALASVLTLAVSLSLQNALGNIFGGFTLLYTKPFAPGHYVEIAGREGTVQEVGLAYTKLATPDNKVISIPNASVVAAEIVNYTVSGTRRVDIAVSCGWKADPQTVTDALLEAAKIDAVLADPAPTAVLKAYENGLVQYCLMVWVKSDDYFPATFAINQNIQTRFQEKSIQMSVPQIAVHTDK